jgi:phosphoribosyl-dephospho-CoA transferase
MHWRHDLVWLTADGWNAALLPEEARQWPAKGWPAVARRQDADADADTVCLGIALPPSPPDGAKRRVGLRVPLSAVLCTERPLLLCDAVAAAPPAWADGLVALLSDAAGLTLRVYGSLAQQAITGACCVSARSDIDLLFYPTTQWQLDAGLALLQKHGAHLPLDGEIMFPNGTAVAWREWLLAVANDAHVLVKEMSGVRLAPPNSLLASLA